MSNYITLFYIDVITCLSRNAGLVNLCQGNRPQVPDIILAAPCVEQPWDWFRWRTFLKTVLKVICEKVWADQTYISWLVTGCQFWQRAWASSEMMKTQFDWKQMVWDKVNSNVLLAGKHVSDFILQVSKHFVENDLISEHFTEMNIHSTSPILQFCYAHED